MRPFAILVAITAIGCSGAGGGTGTPGTGGSGGSGNGGSGGSVGGGSGGGAFMGVPPCLTEASYTTTGTTIQFGVNGALAYEPACLKVPAGTSVTFTGSFVTHPLTPSSMRGTLTGNPITPSNGLPPPDGGMSEAFTFPTPGFYAYYCAEHSDDSGTRMDGVVWVQ